ncbi:MAG: SDR family NAD(P)-dependent oxidoreductase [Rhodospirillaceae bacterium]|nr:SDR family NAD(P)-dependent oxidoreductase [Rhodospirillaceae bacterium]
MERLLVVGVGPGVSASLARLAAQQGMQVALAARRTDKLATLAAETKAKTYSCDAGEPADVERLFAAVERDIGAPNWVVYNASYRARGAITEVVPAEVKKALLISCYAGFLVGQRAAKSMVKAGGGSIFFTGASASVKGYPHSASFAMGKFGLRGLAQSMARELAPKNIHVAHFVIDGGILKLDGDERAPTRGPDGMLHPDRIAETYLHIHRQHRSAWTWEVELRPWVENF